MHEKYVRKLERYLSDIEKLWNMFSNFFWYLSQFCPPTLLFFFQVLGVGINGGKGGHVSYVGLRRPDKKTKESTATSAERCGIEAFDGQRVVQVPWVKNVSTGEKPVLFEASWKKSEVFQGLRFYGTEIPWEYKCGDKYAKIFAQNLKVWIIYLETVVSFG